MQRGARGSSAAVGNNLGVASLVTPAVADADAAVVMCTAEASKVELAGSRLTGYSTVTCTADGNKLSRFATYLQRKTASGWVVVGSPASVARYGSFTHVTHVTYNCVPGTNTYMLSVSGMNNRMPWVSMGPESTITC